MNELKEQKGKVESGSFREASQTPMMLMMGMMVVCCGLPLLLFVILPLVGLKFAGGDISWVAVGLVAVAACVAMMVFRHRKA